MKFILLLTLLSLPTFAEDMAFDKETGHIVPKYVGELKAFKGTVYKKKSGGRLAQVTPGTRFFKNDVLVTDGKSFAKLLIVDDTQLTVGPNSELAFVEFKYVSKTDRKILYSLLGGQLRGEVKNKAQEDDVVIKTKNATLGVRGTKILVNHRTIGNLEVSEFALESGSATVTDQLKNIKHDIIKDERVIVVRDDKINESANEKNKLDADELQYLEDEDNFLPYYKLDTIIPSSTLYSLVNRKEQEMRTPVEADLTKVDKLEKEPKGSFHNLERLNQKLKEDREKVR